MKEKDIKALTEEFYSLEEKEGLFSLRMKGISVWPYIRFVLHRNIMEELGIFQKAHDGLGGDFFLAIRIIASLKWNAIFRNPFLVGGQHETLIIGHPRRKLGSEGKYEDIYADALHASLGEKSLYLALPHRGLHMRPMVTKKVAYMDYFLLLKTLQAALPLSLNRTEREVISRIEALIQKQFGVKIFLKPLIKNAMAEHKVGFGAFTKFLKKQRPKRLVEVVSYALHGYTDAARKLGIHVIELQHGNLGREHVAYNYPSLLRKEEVLSVPDKILTFGDYWNGVFKMPKGVTLKSVGYPYMERERVNFVATPKEEKIILFISQGTIGKELSQIAVDLEKKLPDHKIIYKLHPGEFARWKKEYHWLKNNKGLEVIDGSTPPLYELFAKAGHIVGIYSTAIYEALGFGAPIYLVDLPGIEYMESLISQGGATKVSNAENLLAAMKKANGKYIDTEFFFKSDAMICLKEAVSS